MVLLGPSSFGKLTLLRMIAGLEQVSEGEIAINGRWLDPSNNKAFLDGQISWTINGMSIYYAAKSSKDEKIKAMAEDIRHAILPVGPVGHPTELHLTVPSGITKCDASDWRVRVPRTGAAGRRPSNQGREWRQRLIGELYLAL